MSATYGIFVRDDALTLIGEVDDLTSLQIKLAFNAGGTWVLTLPADGAAAQLLDFGVHRGIEVKRNGVVLLSGPVIKEGRKKNAKTNELVVTGVDDLTWLARRLAYPYVGAAWVDYDARSGAAETVIKGYVTANATAAGTFAERAVDRLTVAADLARGSTVSGAARFDILLALCADLALAGGDLGISVVQVGAGLVMDVYQPVDRSASVTFSEEFGNVDEFDYSEQVPSANCIVAAGTGNLAARIVRTVKDDASIARVGRIEEFYDRRNESDTAKLDADGATELAKKVGRADYTLTSTIATLDYGVDYSLGDRVSGVVDGVKFTQPIREVVITYDAKDGGEKVQPTIRPPGQNSNVPLSIFDEVRALRARIAALETRY